MKIIIRYLKIYIYIQDLRIYDIFITTTVLQQQQTEYLFSINHTVTVLFAQTCTAGNSTFRHSSSACRFLSLQHLKPQGRYGILLGFGIIITSFSFTRFKHSNTPLSFVLRRFWYCIFYSF